MKARVDILHFYRKESMEEKVDPMEVKERRRKSYFETWLLASPTTHRIHKATRALMRVVIRMKEISCMCCLRAPVVVYSRHTP